MNTVPRLGLFAATALLLVSCNSCETSSSPVRAFGAPPHAAAEQAIQLAGRTVAANVNGKKPDQIFIKTATQTFCTRFEFCLDDGRIWYKSRERTGNVHDWELLTHTGIPHSKAEGFVEPERIVEIAADGDTLFAFSADGRLYQCYFERTTVTKPFTWIDTFGWPDKAPLVQNALVSGNRSWAVGTRRKDVLWYDDPNGNPHHYGTMGIETIYFLSADGQRIRYADTGLPADFSHCLLGPERGAFLARSLDASASTLFVINDSGEMYTRLADFDTIGSDPMFFKYTYRKETYRYSGDDYRSNFTPWALPGEDWRKQPPIPLSGKARISDCITILQNGRGNSARELRVAALSANGESGYWTKNIFDPEWQFRPAPLEIPESAFLDLSRDSPVPRGKPLEARYRGSLWRNGVRAPDLSFVIPDFPLDEGNCHLLVRYGTEEATVILYPVEIWTYMHRYDPGRDGTIKNFFVTISIPEDMADRFSGEFRSILDELFGKKNLVLFSGRASATEQFFSMELDPNAIGNASLFLLNEEKPDPDGDFLRRTLGLGPELTEAYRSADLVLDRARPFSQKDRTAVEIAILRNRHFRTLLYAEADRYRDYRETASLSRWGYTAFDILTTVTLLNRIDLPKFRTVTSFGGDIMAANARNITFMSDSHEWVYSHLIELIDLRIGQYEAVLKKLESGAGNANTDPDYQETFIDYFRSVGMPELARGKSAYFGNAGASLRTLPSAPLMPALVLTVADGGTETTGPYILVELEDSARTILGRNGESLAKLPFRAKVKFHLVSTETALERANRISERTGSLEWDGRTLHLSYNRVPFRPASLFEGQAPR